MGKVLEENVDKLHLKVEHISHGRKQQFCHHQFYNIINVILLFIYVRLCTKIKNKYS